VNMSCNHHSKSNNLAKNSHCYQQTCPWDFTREMLDFKENCFIIAVLDFGTLYLSGPFALPCKEWFTLPVCIYTEWFHLPV
jgi:hypothetical protein